MQTPSDQTGGDNTYVLDAESGAEMARLTHQHQIVTKFTSSWMAPCQQASNFLRIVTF